LPERSYKEEISNRQQNQVEINRRKLIPESYGHGRTTKDNEF
jgi:hypothetical protein